MIKKLMMLCVAAMAVMLLPLVLKAEMQIGLNSNYAYSEGSVKIDGRDWHYVEMEDYVSHIHIGYDVVPWVFEYGVDKHNNICIPVTGCGGEKIEPVVTLGTAMSADKIKASVLTDAEFASKFHIGEYKFEIDDDECYYESTSKRLEIWFPRSVWPDGKIVSNRQWILVSLANVRIGQNGFFSPKTFTVGIKGTDLVTPTITIRPDDELPETTKFTPSNVFGLGVTMYSLEQGGTSFDPFFGLWDGVGVGDGVGRVPYRLETDEDDGGFGSLTFQVPSSGELYIKIETMYYTSSSWDFEVDDLQISGSAYGGTFRTIESPDNYWDNDSFWVVLDVKKAGSLTLGNYGEDIIVNGIWFRPFSVSESECLATEAWYREEITVADDMRMANFRGFVTGMGVVPLGQKAKLVCYPNEGEELDHWEFINCEKPEDATIDSPTLTFTVTKAIYDGINAEDEAIKRVIVRPVFKTIENYEPKSDTPVISAVVADGCDTMGKVTGGKTAKAGTKVTLKATANKGYVFSHWDGPLDDSLDPRNPSISYVVGEDDAEFVAYFIPVGEDWVDVWLEMDSEYTTGEEISDIYVEVESGSLATIKVKGLPSGLKFTAKAIYDRDGELLHDANTIYGTPKKSGVYTVEVTATTASKKTSTSSAVIVVRKENEKMVKLSVEEYWNENDEKVVPGKVSGGGIFAEGKKVSLKATANKGFVFAGWYDITYEDWFYGPEDYRNPKLSYVMTDSDVDLVAVFMPAADDWVEVWLDMAEEYTTGEEIDDIYVEVDSGSFATLKFKNLPSGLKYTAKAIYDRSGNLLHEANTIYGTPKKSGVYTVTVTATTASKRTSTSSAVIVVRKENEKMVKLAVQDWYDEDTGTTIVPGKVSGGGIFAEGKKLSLKATANKGFVFAGWWDVNAGTWLDSAEDYRNPKLSYVMTDSDMDLEAVFMPLSEDNILELYIEGNWITANPDDNVFYADDEVAVKLEIDSLSLPKASVSGLPKGLKFDAKTNMITGIPTAPGLYAVTVKLTNQSVKKAIEKKFKIEVSNLTGANDYFVDELDNGEGEKYSLSAGISNIEEFLPSLELNNGTLAVSGLPSGLKYDATNGKITGIATKPGTYTVTLTVTYGKAKYVSTIMIEVEALPDWVVGTFRGSVITEGWGWSDVCSFEVKTTSSGSLSAKLIEPNPAWGSVSLKTYSLIKQNEEGYTFGIWSGDLENWEECSIGNVYIFKGNDGLGVLYAEEYGIDEDEDEFDAYWEGYQDVYSLSSSVIPKPVFKTDKNLYYNIDPYDLDEDDGVYLTFGNNGLVTISPRVGDIWGKSQLLPIEYDAYNGIVTASLWLMGYDEWEDCTFGAELILRIPVTQDGTAKASEIIIEDVFPGPNW